MNGNWYPWSQNATPTDYILAWRYVYNAFVNKGFNSTRVQWIWCPNSGDLGNYTAEQYWVGDNYTDWIGIDGYNWGTSQWWSSWETPSQVFGNMIGRLRNLTSTKPLCFPEYGTASIYSGNLSSVSNKTNWIKQLCTYVNTTKVKMASYFNENKEIDWPIFAGPRGDAVWRNAYVYTAYKTCTQTNDWISPNSSNPRLITDDQFAGRL
jgi:beta-mannanase